MLSTTQTLPSTAIFLSQMAIELLDRKGQRRVGGICATRSNMDKRLPSLDVWRAVRVFLFVLVVAPAIIVVLSAIVFGVGATVSGPGGLALGIRRDLTSPDSSDHRYLCPPQYSQA